MDVLGLLRGWLSLGRTTRLPDHIGPGARVRLRNPLATSQRVWIPEGATGIVVGWDARARRVSVELDTPRTVITVPWAWVEAEPPPAASSGGPKPAP